MQRLCYLFFLLPLLPACQSPTETKEETMPKVLAIKGDEILLSDSSTIQIPHFDDTSYIVLYCIRHAEKIKNAGDNPALTPLGEQRASQLGKIMAGVHLDKACSTNYKRTVQTAELIRMEMDNPPPAETYPPALQDGWIDTKLQAGGGMHYLVVGHQNTIPQLLNRLEGSARFEDLPDDAYDRLFIAVTKGIGQTEVLELRY